MESTSCGSQNGSATKNPRNKRAKITNWIQLVASSLNLFEAISSLATIFTNQKVKIIESSYVHDCWSIIGCKIIISKMFLFKTVLVCVYSCYKMKPSVPLSGIEWPSDGLTTSLFCFALMRCDRWPIWLTHAKNGSISVAFAIKSVWWSPFGGCLI